MSEAERYYTIVAPVTITSGTAISSVLNLERVATGKFLTGLRLVGIYMPSAWDAASLTLQGGVDDLTPQNMYDKSGTEYTIQAAASRAIELPPLDLLGFNTIILRSGTASSPVNQTATRIVNLLLRQI